jgi:hypothetical protein
LHGDQALANVATASNEPTDEQNRFVLSKFRA